MFTKTDENTQSARRDAIAACREELDELLAEYQRGKDLWDDLEWCHATIEKFRELLLDLEEHNPEDPPHAAVYRLAQAIVRIQKTLEDVAVVEVYEGYEEQLRKLTNGDL